MKLSTKIIVSTAYEGKPAVNSISVRTNLDDNLRNLKMHDF